MTIRISVCGDNDTIKWWATTDDTVAKKMITIKDKIDTDDYSLFFCPPPLPPPHIPPPFFFLMNSDDDYDNNTTDEDG